VTDVVSISDLHVAYKLYTRPTDMLREALFGGTKHDTFWALRGVSLSVKEGERIGIVGPNGAGKSTLLKVIAGNLTPTSGRVAVTGKISSLLSMVPTWSEDANGVENIRFNLLLQGVPERRIPELIEEIIEFTELGPFIFHPVKTYSTGMSARLSFAIATATDPGLLIVDEVLGTGDGYFAWKAYQRMQEFCSRGRALLFVSHSVAAVQQMCDRAIWIQNGEIRLAGEVGYVLRQYELDFKKSEDEVQRSSTRTLTSLSPDELTSGGDIRFRIMPETGGHFFSNHYVRAVRVVADGRASVEIPIELADGAKGNGALDVLASEWGRIHEHAGSVCRVLTRVTGRNFGGQLVVRPEKTAKGLPFEIEIETSSQDDREQLSLQMLDMTSGTWKELTKVQERSVDGRWRQQRFQVAQQKSPEGEEDTDRYQRVRAEVEKMAMPDAEITRLRLHVDGEEVVQIDEGKPFEIRVHVRFNRTVDVADVGLKLTRADGVYAFWQSSGMVGSNVENACGEMVFKFAFNDNLFGAGEYFANAHVTNGWKYPDNYPYSKVYARVVNALSFRIVPEFNELDLGILNQRVSVVVE
jgi:ABC-type polysaccharide/polyol phosphate transport system ATPase subunit